MACFSRHFPINSIMEFELQKQYTSYAGFITNTTVFSIDQLIALNAYHVNMKYPHNNGILHWYRFQLDLKVAWTNSFLPFIWPVFIKVFLKHKFTHIIIRFNGLNTFHIIYHCSLSSTKVTTKHLTKFGPVRSLRVKTRLGVVGLTLVGYIYLKRLR